MMAISAQRIRAILQKDVYIQTIPFHAMMAMPVLGLIDVQTVRALVLIRSYAPPPINAMTPVHVIQQLAYATTPLRPTAHRVTMVMNVRKATVAFQRS